jgi:hypothetical protein
VWKLGDKKIRGALSIRAIGSRHRVKLAFLVSENLVRGAVVSVIIRGNVLRWLFEKAIVHCSKGQTWRLWL